MGTRGLCGGIRTALAAGGGRRTTTYGMRRTALRAAIACGEMRDGRRTADFCTARPHRTTPPHDPAAL